MSTQDRNYVKDLNKNICRLLQAGNHEKEVELLHITRTKYLDISIMSDKRDMLHYLREDGVQHLDLAIETLETLLKEMYDR